MAIRYAKYKWDSTYDWTKHRNPHTPPPKSNFSLGGGDLLTNSDDSH